MMRRRSTYTLAVGGIILFTLTSMVQPSYFLANPSLYALFSALVADRGVYVERGLSFGENPRLKLDVYHPDKPEHLETSPVVLFLYGGTWKDGDRAYYGFVGAALAARGITTVIPDYRLYPDVRFPAFLEDAAAAYAWTRRRFTEPSRPIMVMGHSAGAHMAAMLAFNPAYIHAIDDTIPLPAALVGLAGPYAFDLTDYPTTRDIFLPGQQATATIPANFVTRHAPPALLIHGGADETVKLWNQDTLAAKLRELEIQVETHVPDDVTHVGIIRSLAWPFRNQTPVIDLVVGFVQRQARS